MNVGEIEYTVSVETQQSINAAQQFERQMSQVQNSAQRTDRELGRLDSGFSRLATAIKGVIAVSALRSMAGMVQQYQAMAERVEMATRSTEEFDLVQRRLQTTADGTYRSLAEAQELYIRTADSIRDMGYSLEETIDIQDSMSYAFVTNATSADRAQAAINQFTKSINTGKVSADQWETISSAIPTIMNDIAAASGKSASEVRALGAAGKLTARELTEGLRKSLDDTRAAADNMATDLIDAAVRSRNALTTVLVGLENQTGAIQAVTDGIIAASEAMLEFGQDAEKMEAFLKLATVAGASLAAVMAGRMVMALGAYAVMQSRAVSATMAKISADKAAAGAALRRAVVEKELALSAMRAAQTDFNAAKGSGAHAIALNNLTAAKARYMAATTSAAAAQANANRAMTLGTMAANGLRTAMAFLGGPVGIAMLAAVALYQLSGSADKVKSSLTDLNQPLDDAISKLREMSELAREAELRSLAADVDNLKTEYQELARETANALNDKLVGKFGLFGKAAEETVPAIKAVQQAAKDLRSGAETDFNAAAEVVRQLGDEHKELKTQLLDQLVEMEKAGDAAADTAARHDALNSALNNTAAGAANAAAAVDDLSGALRTGSAAADEYAQKAGRALEDAQDRSAVGRLSRDIRDNADAWANATKEQFDAAYAVAFATDKHNEQQAALRKSTGARKQLTEAEREAKKAAEDLERGNESNTETLENLREAIYQTELTGRDLVERQAELSLNKYATPEQIQDVKDLAAQLKNAQDQASLQVQAKSLDKEGSAQDAYQKELTDLQEMLDLKMITEDEYRQYTLDSEASLQQRLMELDEDRYRSQSVAHDLLMSSLDSIGSHATDAFMDFATGAKTGTDAVMAMGQAIGQSVIRAMVDMGVQMAVNAVKEKIFAAQSAATAAATGAAITAAYTPAAAAASVASFGGAAMAGLSSMSAAVPAMMSMFAVGSRRQGGTVSAGSMYRVNEGGAPEIFQNNLGQQYMMPNSRGEVISNKDASKGGGAGGTIVNIYEAANTGAEVTTTKDEQGRDVIDIVLQNLLSDGELAGAVGRITGTQYQGV